MKTFNSYAHTYFDFIMYKLGKKFLVSVVSNGSFGHREYSWDAHKHLCTYCSSEQEAKIPGQNVMDFHLFSRKKKRIREGMRSDQPHG